MSKPMEPGMEALHKLKSTEPSVWQAPSETLSETARAASQHIFSCLKPHAPKSPFDKLLVEGFDAEQIWQQIDLLSQPILANIRRQVRNLEKNPDDIKLVVAKKEENKALDDGNDDDVDDVDMDDLLDDDDDDEEEEGEDGDEVEEEEEGEREDEGKEKGVLDDGFFNVKDLGEYLEADEARELGLDSNKSKNKVKNLNEIDSEEEEEDVDEDEDEDDDDFDDEDESGNARYEDFFGTKKKTVSKRKSDLADENLDSDDEELDEKEGSLSTHQKQLEKVKSEIEKMEKANLEPKTWTMRGEVTAADRSKNSALEVDLDFEHNVRPAPVITEEVTASLEDMIKSRIIEGRFDDVQKLPSLPTKEPREVKEMDDNKSKKGLAEVYEEEYVQKTNPAAAPLSFSDEQKKEASILFKKLCLKLDALSHFHFAPKPVIEDMSIQANVPALAMEEIAPMAVSDAAMLAPEEVFSGKGDIKEEAELTQGDRKRRRAKKKRKFKAEEVKRMAKKGRNTTTLVDNNDGKD